ncbi:MAG: hypothetical protein IPN47_23555 [Gemmatimonadetes bacterium]|nr:hypothetical protein [Gemmatimonadota bacterium]
MAVEESRAKIPVLFAHDVVHGFRTIFPVPLAEASSWDPAAVQRAARIAAAEGALTACTGPLRRWSTSRDPRWGRVVEAREKIRIWEA